MSSRVLNLSRTAQAARANQHVVRSNDPAAVRPVQSLPRTQQIAEFSNTSPSNDRLGHRAKEKLLDREFFLSLLSSASTKREAKSYLSRFKKNHPKSTAQPANEQEVAKENPSESLSSGVNLGSFYGASRAVYDSPVFRQNTTPAPRSQEPAERLHLALIKITNPQSLNDEVVTGVARTLSQLIRLGMGCLVVVDPGKMDDPAMRQLAIDQANRISAAVDEQPDSKSFRLDSALSLSEKGPGLPSVMSRKALLSPLRDGHVVIVTPVAYLEENPRAVPVSANDAVLALTKEFAGLSTVPDPDEDPAVTAERIDALQKEVSLDRVILLHPLGGIPAFRGPQSSHVFINMEQEFDEIEEELSETRESIVGNAKLPSPHKDTGPASALLDSNPFSKFVNEEVISPLPGQSNHLPGAEAMAVVLDGHLENLRLSQQTLAMLPSASSGIIASPQEVANSGRSPQAASSNVSAVGTRRQRNPLIHNLLTDKPLLSSSLPPGRRAAGSSRPSAISPLPPHTTFVKRGMPLTLLPNPYTHIWTAQSQPRLQLNDPSIDLPRLVELIEDSFDRKLDVHDYLKRVNDRIAGIIVAGEYEGGAILTWETPPGVIDDGSPENAARMVPYLDKFAVLKRSQGAGGVADVVFNAMVRTCFPNGVCWRSRKDNPVNKWYFERSCGSWKLADSNWTMFWTTPGLPEDTQRFQDYEAVCRAIQPSWADNKSVID
ncbi:hypothetical protein N7509_001733 [Penicillium cosmopolitanum]|uniref:Amino-acid acetyltransferase, mitochondrial n=1 Tax=Penicillium cosmopolitanum TaxID=1131564 RepID=A0A9X0BCS8_9EURO|nr:uncharacterized protein N7509_001733 [Penicillium cosmopolitanum]KAJ5407850.1 hypothetical protein N7509_001733 [Penicillium cosmopolitanum]